MDDELRLLHEQLLAAQKQKASLKLSERNVVELVMKLQQIGLLDPPLLHTLNGRDFLTQDRLRDEMTVELSRAGRASLVDLAATIGVDLFYVEREVDAIVADHPGSVLMQGEILTVGYWDRLAEEVDELLQQSGQLPIADMAKRFNVGAELITAAITERIGSIIHGKLNGGQLYTPSYVARIRSIVRGALRATTVSTPVSTIWEASQKLQAEAGVTCGLGMDSLLASVFQECVSQGGVAGVSKGTGGSAIWTPAIFARCQKEGVDAFFSQNGYVAFSTLKKLGIQNPRQFLAEKFPSAIALETVLVHDSLLDQLEASAEEAMTAGSWCDVPTLLPSSLSTNDIMSLLQKCSLVQSWLQKGTAYIMADVIIITRPFLQSLSDKLTALLNSQLLSKTTRVKDETQVPASAEELPVSVRGKKSKKVTSGTDDVDEDEEDTSRGRGSGKVKRKDKKAVKTSEPKSKKAAEASKGRTNDDSVFFTEDEISVKILELYPDLEEVHCGESVLSLASLLSQRVRPSLLEAWREELRAAYTRGAEARKKLKDALERLLLESHPHALLIVKGIEVFREEKVTFMLLEKNLMRTIGQEMVDAILHFLAVEYKGEFEWEPNSMDGPPRLLTSVERGAIVKELPEGVRSMGVALVESVEKTNVVDFFHWVEDAAINIGIRLRKLDKKLERGLLHAYYKKLVMEFESEVEPIGAIASAIFLLFFKVHHMVIAAPGRCLGSILSSLEQHLPKEVFMFVSRYQEQVVRLIFRKGEVAEETIILKQSLVESLGELKSLVLQYGGHKIEAS